MARATAGVCLLVALLRQGVVSVVTVDPNLYTLGTVLITIPSTAPGGFTSGFGEEVQLLSRSSQNTVVRPLGLCCAHVCVVGMVCFCACVRSCLLACVKHACLHMCMLVFAFMCALGMHLWLWVYVCLHVRRGMCGCAAFVDAVHRSGLQRRTCDRKWLLYVCSHSFKYVIQPCGSLSVRVWLHVT